MGDMIAQHKLDIIKNSLARRGIEMEVLRESSMSPIHRSFDCKLDTITGFKVLTDIIRYESKDCINFEIYGGVEESIQLEVPYITIEIKS